MKGIAPVLKEFVAQEIAKASSPPKTAGGMDAADVMLNGFDAAKGYIDRGFAEMAARLEALEARPAVKYLGVYQQGKAYGAGNMVTDAGSVWHADRATMARPGSSDDWTLAVKRGRDGSK